MFSLTRWQPSNQLSRQEQNTDPFFGDLLRPFDEIWRELNTPFGLLRSSMSQSSSIPSVDISESADALCVTVDVPGHESKDIDVKVEGDTLRISGRTAQGKPEGEKSLTYHRVERSHQSFERAFTLPMTVDAQKTEASCKNGVLTITLPKREESKPKSISIKVQS
jgi:HSP20 family protein